jgi:hypothetical protein
MELGRTLIVVICPGGMGWKDVEEFEFRALDKLVTGADGWTLDHISHQINKAYIDSEDDFIENYLWRKEL